MTVINRKVNGGDTVFMRLCVHSELVNQIVVAFNANSSKMVKAIRSSNLTNVFLVLVWNGYDPLNIFKRVTTDIFKITWGDMHSHELLLAGSFVCSQLFMESYIQGSMQLLYSASAGHVFRNHSVDVIDMRPIS